MLQKPIILVALANNSELDFLEGLNQERINVREKLNPAVLEGRCEVIIEPTASIEDIFTLFNKYKDRIVVFHYSGHAEQTGLFLESGFANANGLADLFGMQKNLKLVFLNGCSSVAQVQNIQKQNIPNIIATVQDIPDKLAVDFASYFYQALGEAPAYFTIQDSFKNAVAFIKTTQNLNVGTIGEVRAAQKTPFPKTAKDATPEVYWELFAAEPDWSLAKSWAILGEHPNINLMIAFAEEDQKFKNNINKHLTILARTKQINTIEESQFIAGADIDKETIRMIDNAKIILLLISIDFLNSKKCEAIEKIAMENYRRKLSRVIPIWIRKVDDQTLIEFKSIFEFAKLRGLPHDNKPVNQWKDRDAAYTDIAKGIRDVVNAMKEQKI